MRRIAITLDAFEVSRAALEQTALLAERMGAQLEGIFVEDIDLIQIAGLPFVREFRSVSRSEDAISLNRIEQELRVLARRAERLLSEQATRHNVAWSFRIWRGSIDTDLLAADVGADVFALTRLGTSLVRLPVVSTRSSAVNVLFTASEASLRALETAVNLASDPACYLNIILHAADAAEAARLQKMAAEQLGNRTHGVRFISLQNGSLPDLIEILSETNSAVLVIERDNKLLQVPSLKRSLDNLRCPLLIVR